MKINKIKGIGPKKEKILNEMGISEDIDLLYYFPRKYLDKSKILQIDKIRGFEIGTIICTIINIKTKKSFNGKELLTINVESQGNIGEIIFFNASYLKDYLKFQKDYFFYGRVEKSGKYFKMVHPEFASTEKKDFLSVEPSYPLSFGISQKDIRKFVKSLLENEIKENLPLYFIEKNQLIERKYALKNIHFPENREIYKKAKKRLVYEEFFNYILGNRLIKLQTRKGISIKYTKEDIDEIFSLIPFQLTKGQLNAVDEISKDLKSDNKMNRLLQGDVGSGKTIVALIASFLAVKRGYQVAIMVPTEILSMQHYKTFYDILNNICRIEILNGSTKNKEDVYNKIKSGNIDIIIGTHALIQEKVSFKNLALIITDEQHRFGVDQRKKLTDKNRKANYLIMSATPIPRTMSLVLYSDLDITTIDDLPKGRQKVETAIFNENKADTLYKEIKKQLVKGNQGYIIFPLIENSEFFKDVKSIDESAKEIKEKMSEFKIATIHGNINSDEREKIVIDFKNKKYDILITTTVIEVGIDVENANFIIINNAERYGLSQLHQLRGRVGRGKEKAYCFLVTKGEYAENERLKILAETTDGFLISQKDLQIRGPGQVLGMKQHGNNNFLIADFFRHSDIMQLVIKDLDFLIERKETFDEFLQDRLITI